MQTLHTSKNGNVMIYDVNYSYSIHQVENKFRVSLYRNDKCFYSSKTMSLKEASALVTNPRYGFCTPKNKYIKFIII